MILLPSHRPGSLSPATLRLTLRRLGRLWAPQLTRATMTSPPRLASNHLAAARPRSASLRLDFRRASALPPHPQHTSIPPCLALPRLAASLFASTPFNTPRPPHLHLARPHYLLPPAAVSFFWSQAQRPATTERPTLQRLFDEHDRATMKRAARAGSKRGAALPDQMSWSKCAEHAWVEAAAMIRTVDTEVNAPRGFRAVIHAYTHMHIWRMLREKRDVL